ncbi:MAG: hypothetical protein LAO06_03850 [Acidobacteriia bacterium]|nr:hypothetical protein [Terriglobia bacterium]
MSDRKYRQHGYMDRGDKPEARAPGQPRLKKDETFGPRPLNMPGSRTLSRCAQCGTVLATITEPVGQCPKCGFELHSCKQCAHFDPASRFECRQPVPERVARKDTRNGCALFAIRTTVERETSAAGLRADDARKAFENLFKK